jgi:hypothetical protein
VTRKKRDSEQVYAVTDVIINSLYSQQQLLQQRPSNENIIIDLKAVMMCYDTIGHGLISRDDMKHAMNSMGVYLDIESLDIIYG